MNFLSAERSSGRDGRGVNELVYELRRKYKLIIKINAKHEFISLTLKDIYGNPCKGKMTINLKKLLKV